MIFCSRCAIPASSFSNCCWFWATELDSCCCSCSFWFRDCLSCSCTDRAVATLLPSLLRTSAISCGWRHAGAPSAVGGRLEHPGDGFEVGVAAGALGAAVGGLVGAGVGAVVGVGVGVGAGVGAGVGVGAAV